MIPVFRPSVGEEELSAIKDSFLSGWLGLGPKTKQFEEEFARYIGIPFAVGMNSATAALHLGLKLLDVEGGEVITPSLTFVSTNHAVLYNNAKPVFADVEEDTLNISVAEVEKLISPKTKAIIVVHYGGHACDMDAILEMARKKGIGVVEDAAHACGGEYKGKKLGGIGDIGCFSFHAVKNLTTGEGGMVTVREQELASRLRCLRWLGITQSTYDRSGSRRYSWEYGVEELGFKSHMNDIAAAVGLIQLRKLDSLNGKRREIVCQYNDAFRDSNWIELPVEKPYTTSALHNYVIKVPAAVRDELISHLAEKQIAASVHYVPNHLYSVYAPFRRSLPITERVWKRLVTLPLYPDLTSDQIQHVIASVQEFGRLRGLR